MSIFSIMAPQHGGKTPVPSISRTRDLPRTLSSQMKVCMNHQLWINNYLRLDGQPEKMPKSGPRRDSHHPASLFCRNSHFGSFRKQVEQLLWVAWCLAGAGLAFKRDMAAPCQLVGPRFTTQSCDDVMGVKNLTQNCFFWLISVLLFMQTLLPLMTYHKCNKVSKPGEDKCIHCSSKSESGNAQFIFLPPQTENIVLCPYQPRYSWNFYSDFMCTWQSWLLRTWTLNMDSGNGLWTCLGEITC